MGCVTSKSAANEDTSSDPHHSSDQRRREGRSHRHGMEGDDEEFDGGILLAHRPIVSESHHRHRQRDATLGGAHYTPRSASLPIAPQLQGFDSDSAAAATTGDSPSLPRRWAGEGMAPSGVFPPNRMTSSSAAGAVLAPPPSDRMSRISVSSSPLAEVLEDIDKGATAAALDNGNDDNIDRGGINRHRDYGRDNEMRLLIVDGSVVKPSSLKQGALHPPPLPLLGTSADDVSDVMSRACCSGDGLLHLIKEQQTERQMILKEQLAVHEGGRGEDGEPTVMVAVDKIRPNGIVTGQEVEPPLQNNVLPTRGGSDIERNVLPATTTTNAGELLSLRQPLVELMEVPELQWHQHHTGHQQRQEQPQKLHQRSNNNMNVTKPPIDQSSPQLLQSAMRRFPVCTAPIRCQVPPSSLAPFTTSTTGNMPRLQPNRCLSPLATPPLLDLSNPHQQHGSDADVHLCSLDSEDLLGRRRSGVVTSSCNSPSLSDDSKNDSFPIMRHSTAPATRFDLVKFSVY